MSECQLYRYVVDCGRQKERVFASSGVSKFEVTWVSKASAEQRAGRAGRTGPGHCYRLYSSAFYDQHMNMFQEPEIVTTPLEDILLQMRSLGIQDVESFPFPTPPPLQKLRQALKLLINIGAISNTNKRIKEASQGSKEKKDAIRVLHNSGGKLTELGKLIAKFPITPRLAKIIIVAHQSGLLAHGLSLVACLAEKPPFTSNDNSQIGEVDDDVDPIELAEEDEKLRHALNYHPESDALARLRAFGAYSHVFASSPDQANVFCETQGLLRTSLDRIMDLRSQLAHVSSQVFDVSEDFVALPKEPPSSTQQVALRQVLLAGYCDCLAKKSPPLKEGSRRARLTGVLT
jgi:ATP-dependent RNA helicase DHX37/DHR1